MKTVVLLGPPGSGKSTQAQYLLDHLHASHIDMGASLREAALKPTALGRDVYRIINVEKSLVPDEVIASVLREDLTKIALEQDIVLDGAPRNISQVVVVESVLKEAKHPLERVVFLRMTEDSAISRIASRFYCHKKKHTLILGKDVLSPSDVCPVCGSTIEQRVDDTPEGVRKRYRVFLAETLPVIEHYRKERKLIEVDGSLSPEVVRALIGQQLDLMQ
ncbi:MAG: nucleoside monophosphate kinase [Candidatus Moraniibacteriota bacterium]